MLIIICGGMVLFIRDFRMWPQRKALPSTAEDIQEWSWIEPGPLSQDYSYLLRAKISEEEFAVYVNERGLEPYIQPAEDSSDFFISWHPFNSRITHLEWWNPTDSFENTYIISSDSWWEYAKYENGYIFAVAFNI
jgi:hypothetical protein